MSLKEPNFSIDPGLNSLFAGLQPPFIVSVHGEPGTGKSVVGSWICHFFLSRAKSIGAILLGPSEAAAQFMNRSAGLGMSFYIATVHGSFAIREINNPDIHLLSAAILYSGSSDIILIDSLDLIDNFEIEEVEAMVIWVCRQLGVSAILVAETVGGIHPEGSDILIDLSRSGRDVELSRADARLTVSSAQGESYYNFKVGAKGVEIWSP